MRETKAWEFKYIFLSYPVSPNRSVLLIQVLIYFLRYQGSMKHALGLGYEIVGPLSIPSNRISRFVVILQILLLDFQNKYKEVSGKE